MQFRRLPVISLIVVFAALLATTFFAMRRGARPDERKYALQGQIQSLTPDRQEAMIKHGEITGLMPAMTMPYKLKSKAEFDQLKPGDLIDGTLVIVVERRVPDRRQENGRGAD